MNKSKQPAPPPSFPSLVQTFFAEHLTQQRAMSPCTVAAYRDTFMLFLNFSQTRLGRTPAEMALTDMTPELILAFLDHLEQERHNAVRSRNARLAALRAFLKFAAHRDVTSLHAIERALGVPMKRFERPMLGFLSLDEMLAVIGPPGSTWLSQRDHLLLGLIYNTGARVSEIIGVRVADVVLDAAACIHLRGKGRKQRSLPLWRSTVKEVRAWLKLNPQLDATSALLPNRDGAAMTRDNVAKRLALAVEKAAKNSPELTKRHISPHTIRHYVPFLTMSGKCGAPRETTGMCCSCCATGRQSRDIVFAALQTVEEVQERVTCHADVQSPNWQPSRRWPLEALLQLADQPLECC